MKLLLFSTIVALALVPASLASARHELTSKQELKASLRARIANQIHRTWLLQDKTGVKRWPTKHLERHASVPYLHQLAKLWKHRTKEAVRQLKAATALPPHYQAWLCIHRYEGSWTDSGSPYWGGLQFGYNEWHRFGTPYTGADTANLASPIQQMWAAERYYRLSGFYPWPNTARDCGLI